MTDSEIGGMKIKDLFEVDPILTGRTEIETINKLNIGLVWSCGGSNFHGGSPDTDEITYTTNAANIRDDTSSHNISGSVNLPNGATVTGVVVYGDTAADTWILHRKVINSATTDSTMATAAIGTEDTSISNALIDNSTYAYWFFIENVEITALIYGARIIYTI